MSQLAKQNRTRRGIAARLLGACTALFLVFGVPFWAQAQDPSQDEPIEVLIVQGIVKSVDTESLVLTAPGAPQDLPLRLHPDTRYIQGEADAKQEDLHEGQVVRAALIPMGEDLVAVVVEIVPEGELQNTPPGEGAPAPEEGAPPKENPEDLDGRLPRFDEERNPPRSTHL